MEITVNIKIKDMVVELTLEELKELKKTIDDLTSLKAVPLQPTLPDFPFPQVPIEPLLPYRPIDDRDKPWTSPAQFPWSTPPIITYTNKSEVMN